MAVFHCTNVVLLFVPTSTIDRAQVSDRPESKDRFVQVVLLLLMFAVGLYGEILQHVV